VAGVTRRLAYLGTPATAVPPLQALAEAGQGPEVVVTRPDRRRGRGGGLAPSPVKQAASDLGIAVVHETRALLGSGLDLGVVVAYGRIIPADVLTEVPMINLHFSLLPRWRGAAPVERALLAGDGSTGVCVMQIEEGLDTGGVYACEETPIGEQDDLVTLRQRLVAMGSRLLVATLSGPLPPPRLQEGEPTYAEKIDQRELRLDWEQPAVTLARLVRLGRAWTTFRGHRLRVLQAVAEPGATRLPAGALIDGSVAAGGGRLRLLSVQPEGRAAMSLDDWVRGARPQPGERLGT
jgi:methionyl-tRNA formyltransferase